MKISQIIVIWVNCASCYLRQNSYSMAQINLQPSTRNAIGDRSGKDRSGAHPYIDNLFVADDSGAQLSIKILEP